MQRRMLLTSLVVPLLCSCLLTGGRIEGQQNEDQSPPKPTRSGRVRLPAYFAAVVTAQQREDVYKIQMLYLKQIEQLQQQILAMEKKRDQEVDAVLTPEQLAEVQKRRDAAEARRRSRASSAASNPSGGRESSGDAIPDSDR